MNHRPPPVARMEVQNLQGHNPAFFVPVPQLLPFPATHPGDPMSPELQNALAALAPAGPERTTISTSEDKQGSDNA